MTKNSLIIFLGIFALLATPKAFAQFVIQTKGTLVLIDMGAKNLSIGSLLDVQNASGKKTGKVKITSVRNRKAVGHIISGNAFPGDKLLNRSAIADVDVDAEDEELDSPKTQKTTGPLRNFSVAAGAGLVTYNLSSTTSYGSAFINLLYRFKKIYEAGIGYQPSPAFNEVFLELNRYYGNWFLGVQGGSLSYTGSANQSSSGIGFGVQGGRDWEFQPHMSVGGVLVIQSNTWSSGPGPIGVSNQININPYIDFTYEF